MFRTLLAAGALMFSACPSTNVPDATPFDDAHGHADAGLRPDARPGLDGAAIDDDAAADMDAADPSPDATSGPLDAGPQGRVRIANFAVGAPTATVDLCFNVSFPVGTPFPLYGAAGRRTGVPTVAIGEFIALPVGQYDVTLVRASGDCSQPIGPARANFFVQEYEYTEIVTLGMGGPSEMYQGLPRVASAGRDQLLYGDALVGVSGPVTLHSFNLMVNSIPQTPAHPALQQGVPVPSMAYFFFSGVPPLPPIRNYVPQDEGITTVFIYGDATRTTTTAKYLVCDDKMPAIDHLEVCSETLRQ